MTFPEASIKFVAPPLHVLKFPPDPLPHTLPPPHDNPSFAHPFTIPPGIYDRLLSVKIPITIALVYATAVFYLNQLNTKRGNKPWRISQTRLFRCFVIFHNVLLAAYSFWTLLGMVNALRISVPDLKDTRGLSSVIDGLCKIHGPRGLGNAATFDPFSSTWGFTETKLTLDATSRPDDTDVGRIWNEGLAFYGWLFYISKFYEVVDTFIILAKGKKSSVLQTYHHAGAMMCMWAGIRYMAPPIWMFVLVNSGIHALMYTYFTLTTLHVPIPMAIKRLLTTLQITQFVVGATFAFSHLFVAYSIPVSTPSILTAEPSISSTVVSTVTSSAAPLLSWARKLLLRAAGSEPLAENSPSDFSGQPFGIDAIHSASASASSVAAAASNSITKPAGQTIHCTDTSGQAFAILLNCVYLAPLTVLFVRFFARSYSARGRGVKKGERAVKDAGKGVLREGGKEEVVVDGDVNGNVNANGHVNGHVNGKAK